MKKIIKLPLLVSLTTVAPLITLSTGLTSCKSSNEKKTEFGVSVTKWNSENYVIGDNNAEETDASLAPRRGAPFITNIWGLKSDISGEGKQDIVNVTICSDKSEKLTLTNDDYTEEAAEVEFDIDEEILKTNTILPRIKFKSGGEEHPEQEANLLRTKAKYNFALKYKIKRWNEEIGEHEEIASFVIKNLKLDVAIGTTPEQFAYRPKADQTAAITGFADGANITNCDFLVIPATITTPENDELTVDEIDANAFYDRGPGKSLIPDNIIYLILDGFWGKEGTTPTLKTIGQNAFRACHCGGYLYIPSSVQNIKGWAFERSLFTEVDIQNDDSNPTTLKLIDMYAFADCTNLKFDFKVPNTVTKIGERAFYNVPLTSLSFESVDEVTSDNSVQIDDQAFSCDESSRAKITSDLKLSNRLSDFDGAARVFADGSTSQFSNQGFRHIYGTEKCNIQYWPNKQFTNLKNCTGDFYFKNRSTDDKSEWSIISDSNFSTIHFLGEDETKFSGSNLQSLHNLSEIDLIDKCVDGLTPLNLGNKALKDAGQNLKKDQKIKVYYKHDYNADPYREMINKENMFSARDFEFIQAMRVQIDDSVDSSEGKLEKLNSILAIKFGAKGNDSEFLGKLPECIPSDGWKFDHWEDQMGNTIDANYTFDNEEGEVVITPIFVPIEE